MAMTRTGAHPYELSSVGWREEQTLKTNTKGKKRKKRLCVHTESFYVVFGFKYFGLLCFFCFSPGTGDAVGESVCCLNSPNLRGRCSVLLSFVCGSQEDLCCDRE